MKAKQGEHPGGDAGQVVALGIFLVVWLLDSLVLRKTTFLSDRVPLYVRLGAALAVLAPSVSLASGALVIAIFAFYNYLATYEERFLETKFDDAYRRYIAKTGKWLPRLRRA